MNSKDSKHKSGFDPHFLNLKGTTRWVAKLPDGTIVDDFTEENNILLQIRKPIIKLLGASQLEKTAMPYVTAIGFGTNGDAPTEDDTGLKAPVVGASNKLLAAPPQFDEDGLGVTFVVLFDLYDVSVDGIELKEAVVLTQDGTAIARTAIGAYTKLPGLFLEYYHKIRSEVV